MTDSVTLDGRELRNYFGRFATGVCLITTVTPDGDAVALTANSFSSVSLDPPLTVWSLQRSSDAFDWYVGAVNYAINVLSSAQQALSNRYATKGGHIMDAGHFRTGINGSPIVLDSLASFECSLEEQYAGGDHVMLLGRVTRLVGRGEGSPLVFYEGGYRALA